MTAGVFCVPNNRKGVQMKEIFQEYGGILITVIAILSVIAVISVVIGNDANSPIAKAFTGLINNFIDQAKSNGNMVVK